MSVFVGEKSSTDVIDNGTMSEDEVVASDVHVLFFFFLFFFFFSFCPFFPRGFLRLLSGIFSPFRAQTNKDGRKADSPTRLISLPTEMKGLVLVESWLLLLGVT